MAGRLRDDQISWVLSLDAKGVQSELVNLSSKSKDLTADNKKLEAELKLVEKDMDKLQGAMSKLSAAGDTSSEKYQRLHKTFNGLSGDVQSLRSQISANNKAIIENNARAEQLINTMKIEDMTMGQLKKTAQDLEKQLNKTSKSADPEAYDELKKRLGEVNARMGEVDKGSKDTEKSFNMFSASSVKGLGYVAAGVAAAKIGFEAYRDVILSNIGTGREFQSTMDGISNSIDYAKTAIATMDFTNLIEGLANAYVEGKKVSLILAALFEKENSFRLTSAVEKAEIEELKTQVRDVNLESEKRLKIADEIIKRTNELAEKEKNIAKERINGYKDILASHTKLTDAEIDYVIINYNSHQQQIENAKEIIKLEGERNHEWDKALQMMSDDQIENNYYWRNERHLIDQIELLKKSTEYSEEAYIAYKKYMSAGQENVSNYVDALDAYNQIDIKTTRENRATNRLANTIKKRQTGGTGSTVDKELQKQKKDLSELNKKLETKFLEDQTEIRRKYRDGEIKNESDYNRKLFANEQAYYLLREEALENFITEKTKNEVKDDVNKQVANIQDKRVEQEVKYHKELEKILLDANPLEKEKQAFAERLDALGLYGKDKEALLEQMAKVETDEDRIRIQQQIDSLNEYGIDVEKLTEDQLKALELLEKQHQDNIKKIREAGAAQAKKDAETRFLEGDGTEDNPGFKGRKEEMQIELNDLMAQSAANPKSFDAEIAVHVQRLKMINEEVEARRAAGLETTKQIEQQGKIEVGMTATVSKELQKRVAQFDKYGNMVGQAMGKVITGQENALRAFGDASIDIVFDVLSKIIEAELIKVMASSTSAIMRSTAEAMATPQSALSFGASGFATAAILTGAITAATVAAKAALKGMLGKKKGSSSSSGSSESKSSGSITVKKDGFAEGGFHEGYTGSGGKYEVKGIFPDGQPYHGGEYIIPKEELKVPWINNLVRKVDATRLKRTGRNPLPEGFAEGGYHGENIDSLLPFGMNTDLMNRFVEVLDKLEKKEFKTYLGITELEAEKRQYDQINDMFSNKDNKP